ncbi:MAG: thiol-disulfide isomerase/thioredoxin [Glaciecola sp.]|jgi:thiol-disulfide isomerase/thioredoxin
MRTKSHVLIFITLLLAAGIANATAASEFTLPDFHSNEQLVSLKDFKGKVVYLDFWASWCKPCRTSFGWMNEMQAKYAEQGFEVISINLDQDKDSINTFLASYPAHFKILLDPKGEVAADYGLVGMPSSYLIDKRGILRKTHTGFFSKNKPQYEQEIISLLSE